MMMQGSTMSRTQCGMQDHMHSGMQCGAHDDIHSDMHCDGHGGTHSGAYCGEREDAHPGMQGYVHVEVDDRLRKLLNMIFSDEFMQANTNFDNFEAFQYSSAVITNWKSEHMVYAQLLMDNFVKESTRFQTWDEMVKTACDERFGKVEG